MGFLFGPILPHTGPLVGASGLFLGISEVNEVEEPRSGQGGASVWEWSQNLTFSALSFARSLSRVSTIDNENTRTQQSIVFEPASFPWSLITLLLPTGDYSRGLLNVSWIVTASRWVVSVGQANLVQLG